MGIIPRLSVLCIGGLIWLNVGCSSADPTAAHQPTAEYDAKSGRLRRLTFDSNGNGRNDAVSAMDGARIDHIEVDTDENGEVDYWEYYGADSRLIKVGISRRNDGIVDAFEFYGQAEVGSPTRIEVSTRRDGRFDRVEFYTKGILARVEEDTNGDGRVDKWEVYHPVSNRSPGEPPSSVASVAFDDAYRGTATRRLVFADDGTVRGVEVDPDGDGVFVARQSSSGAQ